MLKKYDSIITQVSKELNIPKEVVALAYKSSWDFIKNTIKHLPLRTNLSKDDFNKLKTSFTVPSIGKFYVNYTRIININKEVESIKKLKNAENKKDKTNV